MTSHRITRALLPLGLAALLAGCGGGGGGGQTTGPTTPSLGLSSHAAGLAAFAGGANPLAKSISISNTGTGSLSGLQATVRYATGQPTGWLSPGLTSTVAPTTLYLNGTTGSLTPGTYTATVTVSGSGAVGSPDSVLTSFTVLPGATLSEAEPNDVTPQVLPAPSSTDYVLGGTANTDSDVDLYSVTLSGTTNLYVRVDWVTAGDIELSVANPSGIFVRRVHPGASPASCTLMTLPAGTYLLRVDAVRPVGLASAPATFYTLTVGKR